MRRASLIAVLVAFLTAGPTDAHAPSVERWRPLVEAAAARHGVPADVVLAIMAIESGGNPGAIGPAGEVGLLQILPATGRLLGVTNLHDPAVNIDTGARYLALELRATGGDLAMAVAGYNGGPRARANPLPSTRAYVATVLARRAPPALNAAVAPDPAPPPRHAGGSRLAAAAREE